MFQHIFKYYNAPEMKIKGKTNMRAPIAVEQPLKFPINIMRTNFLYATLSTALMLTTIVNAVFVREFLF